MVLGLRSIARQTCRLIRRFLDGTGPGNACIREADRSIMPTRGVPLLILIQPDRRRDDATMHPEFHQL